jgi:hypothetical protein
MWIGCTFNSIFSPFSVREKFEFGNCGKKLCILSSLETSCASGQIEDLLFLGKTIYGVSYMNLK